jgi:hypothetical protein
MAGGVSLGGANMSPEEATRRLQEKQRGKEQIEELREEICVVCGFLVREDEMLRQGSGIGAAHVGHQTCFYCSSCGNNLKPNSSVTVSNSRTGSAAAWSVDSRANN